jgi:hypothetical protein
MDPNPYEAPKEPSSGASSPSAERRRSLVIPLLILGGLLAFPALLILIADNSDDKDRAKVFFVTVFVIWSLAMIIRTIYFSKKP